MKECPKSGDDLETVMSNFDHEIDEGAEVKLRVMDCYGTYTARNFCGFVWWNGEQFCCEVMQYRQHVSTVYGESLKAIMNECCKRYGRA